MKFVIATLPGDGIGPEVIEQTCAVFNKIGELYGHSFEFKEYLVGGAAIDQLGEPLPEETLAGCLASDSVLLGAVGGPKWEDLTGPIRPSRHYWDCGENSAFTPTCAQRYSTAP